MPAADELDAALEAEGSEICEPSWSLGDEEDEALVGTNEGRAEDGPEDRRECGRGGDCAGVEESWADGGPLVLGWGKDTGWGIEGWDESRWEGTSCRLRCKANERGCNYAPDTHPRHGAKEEWRRYAIK